MKTMCSKILILSLASVFFFGCKKSTKGDIQATVIESNEVIISEISPRELVPLDTLAIVDGQFSYSPKVEAPVFLLFEFDSGSRVPVLFVPGDMLVLSITDTIEYGTFTASGSPGVERMARQRDIFVKTARIFDSLNYVNSLYADSSNFALIRTRLNEAFAERMEAHRSALLAIIDEDTTDLSNLMAFYQSLGRIEFLEVARDYPYYKKVRNGLNAAHPNNEHTRYFAERLQKYEEARQRQQQIEAASARVQPGSVAPEITLPDVNGELRSLSALRGKVVLIDFWASWCGPCRRANPELVRIYTKYQAKGFEIFSVSLDGLDQQPNPKNDWRFAIEKDGLVWPNHVSDLKGYQSQVIDLYGFEGIPYAVLVDRNGKIIAKNVRIDALEAAIKAAL